MIPLRCRKIFFLVLFGLFSTTAQAKIIAPDDLILRMLETNRELFQAYLELEVTIYDPEAQSPINDNASTDPIPVELPQQGFRQQITFIRDEFIGIETYSLKGQLQHVWLRSGFQQAMQKVNPQWSASEADLDFIALSFFTRLPDKLNRHLGNWGIAPLEVTFNEVNETVMYRLGQGDEFLLVHPKSFTVQEIQTTVQLQGNYFPLRIKITERDQEKRLFPTRLEYRINNRLFKLIRVTKLNFTKAPAKRAELMKTHKALMPETAVSPPPEDAKP